MNDTERENWVMNDEYLYTWWQSSRIGIARFVRQNRQALTKYILQQLGVMS